MLDSIKNYEKCCKNYQVIRRKKNDGHDVFSHKKKNTSEISMNH